MTQNSYSSSDLISQAGRRTSENSLANSSHAETEVESYPSSHSDSFADDAVAIRRTEQYYFPTSRTYSNHLTAQLAHAAFDPLSTPNNAATNEYNGGEYSSHASPHYMIPHMHSPYGYPAHHPRSEGNRSTLNIPDPTHVDMCSLFVGNLPAYFSDEEVWALFDNSPHVQAAQLMKRKSRSGNRCAIVRMSTPDTAATAIQNLNRKYVGSQPITVRIANTREFQPVNRTGHVTPHFGARAAAPTNNSTTLPRSVGPPPQTVPPFFPPEADGVTLFVRKLPADVTEEEFCRLCSIYGNPLEMGLLSVRGPIGERSGIVRFAHLTSANVAARQLHGSYLRGAIIAVQRA